MVGDTNEFLYRWMIISACPPVIIAYRASVQRESLLEQAMGSKSVLPDSSMHVQCPASTGL